MKALKLALCLVLVAGTAFHLASAAADPSVQAPTEEAVSTAASGEKAVCKASLEATESDLDPASLFVPAEEDRSAPLEIELGYHHKICVPDFCQSCNTDDDCTAGNRCRAQLCP